MGLNTYKRDLFSYDFFSLVVEFLLFIISHFLLIKYITELNYYTLTIGIFVGFSFLIIGHEIGAHRFFSHNSFECESYLKPLFHVTLALSNYGSALSWLTLHRVHHVYPDQERDPTSPRQNSFFQIFSNFWKFKFHFQGKHRVTKTIVVTLKGLNDLKSLNRWRHIHPLITIIYSLFLLNLGVQFFIMFFCIPTLFVSYSLNSINYFGHSKAGLGPQNVPWLNFFSLGGGWHKNHHQNQFQYSFHSHRDFVGKLIKKFFLKA